MADTQITISPQDVANAGNFLEQYLSDSDPSGDFSKGTVLRDHTIGAIAAVFAFLQADSTQIRQLQSLASVQTATGGDPTALRDAVIAILSNVFITPKSGSKSRGIAIGHANQQVDMFIQPAHRFTRLAGYIFVVDSADTFFVPATELLPIMDSAGTITEYQFRIPLIAVNTGTGYDIDPGLFADFDRFNPYVTRIENLDKFSGGKGPETIEEILARAPTAISVRNLINDRSIQAVLEDNFDEIRAMFVAGIGDPEMQRDVTTLASHMAVHVGGMVDIYPLLDLVETSFTGNIGGFFARPDGIICILADFAHYPFSAAIVPGDILRITAGLPIVPQEYKIVANGGWYLQISERTPFPLATYILDTAVSYTVGRISPLYSDIWSDVGGATPGAGGIPLVTGLTYDGVASSGRFTLPGGPVMDILDVAILDPQTSEAPFIDSADGFLHFTSHVNQTPHNRSLFTDGPLEYQTIVHNPLEAQSKKMWMEIVIGTDSIPDRYDGYVVRVRYRTLASFAAIDTFVTKRDERTVAASQLVRGHNPVSLTIPIQYKLRSDAPALLDDNVIAQTVADFINVFDTTVVPIDTSVINDLLRKTFPTIASVLPLTITYTLFAPTGDVVTYQTVDEVRIDAAKRTAGPVLDLALLGVTNRTLRYLANTDGVTATRIV